MDRGHPVYNFRCAIRPRILRDDLEFSEPKPRFLPYRIYVQASELRKWFSAAIPPVPLASFQTCSAKGRPGLMIPQMTLSLVFGR